MKWLVDREADLMTLQLRSSCAENGHIMVRPLLVQCWIFMLQVLGIRCTCVRDDLVIVRELMQCISLHTCFDEQTYVWSVGWCAGVCDVVMVSELDSHTVIYLYSKLHALRTRAWALLESTGNRLFVKG